MIQNGNNYQVGTPAVVASYSGFWIRLVAFAIDLFIVAIPWVIIAEIVHYDPKDAPTVVKVIFSLSFYYYFGVSQAKHDGTLGKRLVGIRLVRDDFKSLSAAEGIFRCMMHTVSALPLFAGYLLVGIHSQKKAFHDLIVKTIVVPKDYLDAVRAGRPQQSQPAASTPIGQSSLDAIDKLHQLKQKGALTEDEFQQQKAKLVG